MDRMEAWQGLRSGGQTRLARTAAASAQRFACRCLLPPLTTQEHRPRPFQPGLAAPVWRCPAQGRRRAGHSGGAVARFCSGAREVYLCGGGARNSDLVRRIARTLPNIPIASTLQLGVHPDWVEAMAFAWLAQRTVKGEAGNLPEVTGARKKRVLGAIYAA